MTSNRLNTAHKTIGADGSNLAQQQIINQAKSIPYGPLSQSVLAHDYYKLVLRSSLGQLKQSPRVPRHYHAGLVLPHNTVKVIKEHALGDARSSSSCYATSITTAAKLFVPRQLPERHACHAPVLALPPSLAYHSVLTPLSMRCRQRGDVFTSAHIQFSAAVDPAPELTCSPE